VVHEPQAEFWISDLDDLPTRPEVNDQPGHVAHPVQPHPHAIDLRAGVTSGTLFVEPPPLACSNSRRWEPANSTLPALLRRCPLQRITLRWWPPNRP